MPARLKVALLSIVVAAGCRGAEPGVTGVLKDEKAQPLAHTTVLACMATTCFYGRSDSNGRFTFAPLEPPANIALKTQENLSATPRHGAALLPVRLDGSSLVDVGDLYVPHLPTGAPIRDVGAASQTLTAGDGLELTLRRHDVIPQPGEILDDVAARAIPLARLPTLVGLEAEQIIACYALHPFGAVSRSPIGVRAPSPLTAGTRVNFRTISHIDGKLSKPVPGEADGTFVATDPTQGISELTWLVISKD